MLHKDADEVAVANDASEHSAPVQSAAVDDFEPSSIAQAVFGRTAGPLGDSFHFRDRISASHGSGVTEPGSLNDIPALMSHQDGAAGTHGLLAILEEAQAIEAPPGQHREDHFNIMQHHAPGALVTHVPFDLIV